MRKFENFGRQLSRQEQKSVMGGDQPVTGCIRKCRDFRDQYNYAVTGNTCEVAQCMPFDTDNGCTCETYIFEV